MITFAFALDPKNEEILVAWSNVDHRLQRWRAYEQRIAQAYALNPNNAHVLRAVGTLLSNTGDRDRAAGLRGSSVDRLGRVLGADHPEVVDAIEGRRAEFDIEPSAL